MKIFCDGDENLNFVSKEDKEKISMLKLLDSGEYLKNVGVRHDKFFLITENESDTSFLDYSYDEK